MSMKVKVFGERNTGTRATIAMIRGASGVETLATQPLSPEDEAHFAAWEDRVESAYSGPWRRVYREAVRDLRAERRGPTGAWKHGCAHYEPAFKAQGINVMFLVRNPYSWILSLYRKPYHQQSSREVDFDLFLRRPWKTVARDETSSLLASPLELWNHKLASYRDFATAARADDLATTTMRFEDFVTHPSRALNAALSAMGYRPSGLRTLAPTKPMGKKARERRYYYGQEQWRRDLIVEDVAFINNVIDWDLAEQFGYARLEPDDFALEREVSLYRKTGAATAA